MHFSALHTEYGVTPVERRVRGAREKYPTSGGNDQLIDSDFTTYNPSTGEVSVDWSKVPARTVITIGRVYGITCRQPASRLPYSGVPNTFSNFLELSFKLNITHPFGRWGEYKKMGGKFSCEGWLEGRSHYVSFACSR